LLKNKEIVKTTKERDGGKEFIGEREREREREECVYTSVYMLCDGFV
jgi:hypothetical protein